MGEKLECAISLGMICDTDSAWMWLEGMDQGAKGSGYCKERKRIQIPVSPLIGQNDVFEVKYPHFIAERKIPRGAVLH